MNKYTSWDELNIHAWECLDYVKKTLLAILAIDRDLLHSRINYRLIIIIALNTLKAMSITILSPIQKVLHKTNNFIDKALKQLLICVSRG